MIWNVISLWLMGAFFFACGLNSLNLIDFLLASFAVTAGVVLLVQYRKARKEKVPGQSVSLLAVILAWGCFGLFSLWALDTRNLFDYLLAGFFLADGIVNSVLYGKHRKIRRGERRE